MDLLKRRQEIIDRFKVHETVKQSPLHRDSLPADEKADPYSERPVAFLCDDEVVVVGPCVEKVYAGLAAFMKLVDSAPEAWASRTGSEAWVRQALAKVKKQLATPKPAELRVHQQVWNGFMFAMQEVGRRVVLSDGIYETPLD